MDRRMDDPAESGKGNEYLGFTDWTASHFSAVTARPFPYSVFKS